ncbi:VirB4-like conjugal transfer ATPase, CD1110 family [Fructobacillus evanidus]|uniref:VirB4-like conjugal transfer ATPase, CD1110 family n=1 Tax=Fructobacillus evanidus TaxID=3064281 RepID=UPI002DB41DA8|nr:Type IV secretory pathway [Fructobacillus sp. LMG 32999]CAK1231131.1 Type IV secretory pathway [Fructobacillus sp. LMG 32999]CAK1232345.1 Type IV secretory pathway [Fructobacillus sp. LMG 32999]CAK1240920.1 Type IV secretory pathway [Fructobacillus sp. LMG 32999]
MFKKRKSLSVAEQRKQERLARLGCSTQDTLQFEDLSQEGLMKIDADHYSRAYELSDVPFEALGVAAQQDVIVSYGEALNTLNDKSHYQLLVVNEHVGENAIENLLMPMAGTPDDVYRQEINDMMKQRFSSEENEYQVKRYAIITTKQNRAAAAEIALSKAALAFQEPFRKGGVPLTLRALDDEQRVRLINQLTNPGMLMKKADFNQLHAKDLVAPSLIELDNNQFQLNEQYARVLYAKYYPEMLEDDFLKNLTEIKHEIAISLHAQPYNMRDLQRRLQTISQVNKMDQRRQQKDNAKEGVDSEFVSGLAKGIGKTTEALKEDFSKYGQKLFTGTLTVMVVAQNRRELKTISDEVKAVGEAKGVFFESAYNYQEEAFNTTLPIGRSFLLENPETYRDMTTLNVATQRPFTSVELQNPHGEFFGQNQITGNVITIDRKDKQDLLTPSGLVLGSSGSGKSVAVKYQLLNTLLNHPKDRIIIVDPESEYLEIGQQLGAQILDISTGTDNHLNLMDLADRTKLREEDKKLDFIKEKSNLLTTMFDKVLTLSDAQKGVIDLITHETYEKYEKPTLVDWQTVLKNRPEKVAQDLALSTSPYTIGSQDVFSYETNIDLSGRFLIFNTKQLDDNMKPFAMQVILDQIWKQVVASQNIVSTWLFFDEIQVNFQDKNSANWFANLWARVRKYGAIPTGITQNISNITQFQGGRNLTSNTEFMMLLRQKAPDLKILKEELHFDENVLDQFVNERAEVGTGLIRVNGIMVPFKNPIPKHTKLYELLNTDVDTDKE